jgi:hypothetical protein
MEENFTEPFLANLHIYMYRYYYVVLYDRFLCVMFPLMFFVYFKKTAKIKAIRIKMYN